MTEKQKKKSGKKKAVKKKLAAKKKTKKKLTAKEARFMTGMMKLFKGHKAELISMVQDFRYCASAIEVALQVQDEYGLLKPHFYKLGYAFRTAEMNPAVNEERVDEIVERLFDIVDINGELYENKKQWKSKQDALVKQLEGLLDNWSKAKTIAQAMKIIADAKKNAMALNAVTPEMKKLTDELKSAIEAAAKEMKKDVN